MNKWIILFAVVFLTSSTSFSFAAERDESLTGLQRSGKVFMRGIKNVAGYPAELYTSFAREKEIHPKLWPITGVPRTLTNLFTRAASAVNDIFLSPIFVAPFTSDITPITEPMGLPEYPWQIES